MDFNRHSSALVGQHAFLSPSKPAWLNYEEDKLDRVFAAHVASQRGTAMHAFANDAIRLGIRLPDTEQTINQYVNDAIGYRMTPELTLFYSANCFGTADALGFRNNKLRVHDLKTGTTPTNMAQLRIYAALFCLEYKFRPSEIETEIRIYQNAGIKEEIVDPMDLVLIMDRIVTFDKRINYLRMEAP